MNLSEFLEIIMIVCFGASWPFNVYRSYKARCAICSTSATGSSTGKQSPEYENRS